MSVSFRAHFSYQRCLYLLGELDDANFGAFLYRDKPKAL
jgi:hypothetical protein